MWLLFFGEPRRLRTLADRLQKGVVKDSELKVVIFGGGEYGFTLAQMFRELELPRSYF